MFSIPFVMTFHYAESSFEVLAYLQFLKVGWLKLDLFLLFQIREGRLQGVGQCLIRDYRMVCHVMMGEVSKDFFEVCNPFKCAHVCVK